jgi:hypothetical protein
VGGGAGGIGGISWEYVEVSEEWARGDQCGVFVGGHGVHVCEVCGHFFSAVCLTLSEGWLLMLVVAHTCFGDLLRILMRMVPSLHMHALKTR